MINFKWKNTKFRKTERWCGVFRQQVCVQQIKVHTTWKHLKICWGLFMYIDFGTIILNVKKKTAEGSVCLCLQIRMCVLGTVPTIHRESSVRKGMVNSSCVQVSWLDLLICIHLHVVKRSYCWQLPESTVFLDPSPILSAWLHGTVKLGVAGWQPSRSASLRALQRHLSVYTHQLTMMTSKCHWVRGRNIGYMYVGLQQHRDTSFSAKQYWDLNLLLKILFEHHCKYIWNSNLLVISNTWNNALFYILFASDETTSQSLHIGNVHFKLMFESKGKEVTWKEEIVPTY